MEATGYAPGVKDKMTDAQASHLLALAGRAISTQRVADDALADRDRYIIELSDAGVSDTEMARLLDMNRVTINRIANNYRKRTSSG